MINPYENINWDTSIHVKSVSHVHILSQGDLDKVAALGYEHIPISHYNPSSPKYPLADFFQNVPAGVFGSPNSEKVRFYGEMGHVNALGSFLEGYGWNVGDSSASWQTVFKLILENLQYKDGGGITLNHPTDGNFSLRTKMLDYDPRVLGVEIYNNMMDVHEGATDYCKRFVALWDKILKTGRKCWGFCVIDWPSSQYEPLRGSNILIVSDKTEHECLRAYRNGAFYSMIDDRGIRFNRIYADGEHVECEINQTANIAIITQDGTVKSVNGTGISYDFKPNDVYARIEVTQDGEYISTVYSNPIIIKPTYHYNDFVKKVVMIL